VYRQFHEIAAVVSLLATTSTSLQRNRGGRPRHHERSKRAWWSHHSPRPAWDCHIRYALRNRVYGNLDSWI